MPRKKDSDKDKVSTSLSSDLKSAPQVNDVAKPGETAALPTSKPIITSHAGMIKQDPMVSGKTEDSTDPDALSKKSEIKIEPSEETTDQPDGENLLEKDAKTTAEIPHENYDDKDISADSEESPAQEEPDSSKKTDDESNSDSAAIDSLATSAEAQKLAAKQAEEDQKRNEKVQELTSSKKYFIPIVEGGHKASSQRLMTWLLLFLLLASVGVYLAIDAGYLDVGIALPYDLIKN